MYPTTVAEPCVPLEYFLRPTFRSKRPSLPELPVLHFLGTFRGDLGAPFWYRSTPPSRHSPAVWSSADNFPMIVTSKPPLVIRLSSTSGPSSKFGNASSRFSHSSLGSTISRNPDRCRSPIAKACEKTLSWSISSATSSISPSSKSSRKRIPSRSDCQIASDGKLIKTPSTIAQNTRACAFGPWQS